LESLEASLGQPPTPEPTPYPSSAPSTSPTAAPTQRACSDVSCEFDNSKKDKMVIRHHKNEQHGKFHECGTPAFELHPDDSSTPDCFCECDTISQRLLDKDGLAALRTFLAGYGQEIGLVKNDSMLAQGTNPLPEGNRFQHFSAGNFNQDGTISARHAHDTPAPTPGPTLAPTSTSVVEITIDFDTISLKTQIDDEISFNDDESIKLLTKAFAHSLHIEASEVSARIVSESWQRRRLASGIRVIFSVHPTSLTESDKVVEEMKDPAFITTLVRELANEDVVATTDAYAFVGISVDVAEGILD